MCHLNIFYVRLYYYNVSSEHLLRTLVLLQCVIGTSFTYTCIITMCHLNIFYVRLYYYNVSPEHLLRTLVLLQCVI